MSCHGCFAIHTNADRAIACYGAWVATQPVREPVREALASPDSSENRADSSENCPPVVVPPRVAVPLATRPRNPVPGRELPPDWRRIRAGVLNRDGRRCRYCGTRERLTVHHVTPRPQGTHDPRNLVTLCASCHDTVEQPAEVSA